MNEDEYKKKKAEISLNYMTLNQALIVEFAESNNMYKIGDVVKDHQGYSKIKSMSVGFSFNSEIPEMIYDCKACKVNGVPYKRDTERVVYQSNIEKFKTK